MKRLSCAAVLFLLFFALPLSAQDNLVQNGDFEEEYEGTPIFWDTDAYVPQETAVKFYLENDNPYSGNRYAVIESLQPNDARYVQPVPVEPDTVYKLSCRIRVSTNEKGRIGASISLMDSGFQKTSQHLEDTQGNWQYIEFLVRTAPKQTKMLVAARFGWFGNDVTGKAAFDDFQVVKLDNPGVAYVANIDDSGLNSGSTKENKGFIAMLIIFIILAILGITAFLLFTFVFKPRKTAPVDFAQPAPESSDQPFDSPLLPREPARPEKYTKRDFILCGVLTFVYIILAYTNLGGFSAPETHWKPSVKGESFYVDLGAVKKLRAIYFFPGVPNGHTQCNYKMEASNDLETWEFVTNFRPTADYELFLWCYSYINYDARYVKITAEVPNVELKELGFFEEGNTNPLPVVAVNTKGKSFLTEGDPGNLFDEQDTIPDRPTMMNGMPTSFDELYHARTAYEHLHGIHPFETTHPPLGKLIIAIGIIIFGMVPFGWRFMGTTVGVLMVILMYIMGKKLFKKSEYAFLGAFLLAFDFMHFLHTRIATIDSYAVFFIMLMYYFMYLYYKMDFYRVEFKKTLIPLLLSGICWGIGAAVKWTTFNAGFGLALLFFVVVARRIAQYQYTGERLKSKKEKLDKEEKARLSFFQQRFPLHLSLTLGWCVLVFIIIPVIIYIMAYIPYMALPGPRHELKDVWQEQKGMWDYHANIEERGTTHPESSRWYEWPVMNQYKIYYVGQQVPAGKMETIVAIGNPAVWWVCSIAVLTLLAAALAVMYGRLADANLEAKQRKKGNGRLLKTYLQKITEHDRLRFFVLMSFASQYVPWIINPRQLTFIYHFFNSVPFIIFCFVFLVMEFKSGLQAKGPWKVRIGNYLIYGYMAVVVLLFIMFYPVLTGITVDRNYVNTFLHWLPSWHF